DDFIEAVVSSEVGWVGFGDADDVSVEDVGSLEDADLFDFGNGELFDLVVGHTPKFIRVVTEILKANPDFVGIGDEVRAPVIEDLQATYLYVGFLNVDPCVLER